VLAQRKPVDCARYAPLLALAAALSACAAVPPGIRTEDPETADRVDVRALPLGWRRVAVVPFGGDAAHRRPAEELVSLELARSTRFGILRPYAFQQWHRRVSGDAAALAASVDRWMGAYLPEEATDAPELPHQDLRAIANAAGADALDLARVAPDAAAAGPALPRDELRTLAKAAGADALVLGRVLPGAAVAEIVLVDGASGEAVAILRRAGSRYASETGIHELAMSSTSRALDDLLEVLRTPEGQVPRVSGATASSAAAVGAEVTR
jgi:hypothetical protein